MVTSTTGCICALSTFTLLAASGGARESHGGGGKGETAKLPGLTLLPVVPWPPGGLV